MRFVNLNEPCSAFPVERAGAAQGSACILVSGLRRTE